MKIIATLAIALFLTPSADAAQLAPNYSAANRIPSEQSATFRNYTIRTYSDPASLAGDATYFEIRRNGKLLRREGSKYRGSKFFIGPMYADDPDAKLIAPGTDITGDGQPDVVISGWSGGANCCLTFHIFEIGAGFREIGEIHAMHGDAGPHFVHLMPGAGLQIQVYDWTFANWHSDFADSPAPRVILKYTDGVYRVAPDLMHKDAPSMKDLMAKAAIIRSEAAKSPRHSWPAAKFSPQLWGTVLDLIYTGHPDLAPKFLDLAWPPNISGKEKFLRDFHRWLRRSPYVSALPAMAITGTDNTSFDDNLRTIAARPR